jgi:phage-related minor tail protein
VSVGDEVAVHWDRLVDVLRPDQAEVLRASTEARLAATNARLAVAAGAPCCD